MKTKEADSTVKSFQDTLDTALIKVNNFLKIDIRTWNFSVYYLFLFKASYEETSMKKCEFELNTVLNGIKKIYNILVCDQAPILELLGEFTELGYYQIIFNSYINNCFP